MIFTDFPLTYQAKDIQQGWYELWENKKYFQPKEKDHETYRIILPPPNVTGTLHLGHALTAIVQDCLTKWLVSRHSHIIYIIHSHTQAVVERYLFKTRHVRRTEMSQEEFLNFVNDWKNEKTSNIRDQLKTLGASLDWQREYFTLSKVWL